MHTNMHTQTNISKYKHISTHAHIRTRTHMCVRAHTHTHTHTHTRTLRLSQALIHVGRGLGGHTIKFVCKKPVLHMLWTTWTIMLQKHFKTLMDMNVYGIVHLLCLFTLT